MHLFLASTLVLAIAAPPTTARPKSGPASRQPSLSATEKTIAMPIREVEFYESGVGVIVRQAEVRGTASPAFTVVRGHLDDASKSLFLETQGDLRVDALDLPTPETFGSALVQAGFGAHRQISADDPLQLADVLRACIGEEVEIRRAGKRLRGTLVAVEAAQLATSDIVIPQSLAGVVADEDNEQRSDTMLTLLGAGGELTQLAHSEIDDIALLNPDAQLKLARLIATTAPRRTREPFQFLFHTRGSGTLRARYLQETPLWKMNYRLQVQSGEKDEKARIEPWLLVHNDGVEDWKNVKLRVVSGQPHSAITPTNSKRYFERVAFELDNGQDVAPLARATASELAADEDYGGAGGGSGSGYGRGSGTGFGGRGAISPTGGKESEYGALGEMLEAAASNGPVGFKLELKDSISLAAGHSLLAQLPPSELSATWLRVIDSERAQKAIHIRNTSAITLPEGTLAIYLNGSFLGETMLPRMVSGDDSLLFHGEELELELESEVVPRESLLRELRFLSDKSIQLFYRRKRDFAVTLRNRSEESQLIYADIGLPDRAAVDSKQGDFRIIRVKELDQPMLEIRLDKGGVFAQTLHVEDNFEKIDGPQNGVWQATKLDSELESILRKHQPPADLKIEPSVVEQIKKLREELAHLFARERALVAKKADLQAETTTIKSLRTSIAQGANLRRRARRELETQLLAHQQQELRLRAQVRELEQEIDGLYLKQPLISRKGPVQE